MADVSFQVFPSLSQPGVEKLHYLLEVFNRVFSPVEPTEARNPQSFMKSMADVPWIALVWIIHEILIEHVWVDP